MTISWLPAIPISGRVDFPNMFVSSAILIWINSPLTPVWRKAGNLRIEIDIEGELITIDYRAVDFGKSLIPIPAKQYKLSFDPVRDLSIIYPNTSISIYPLSSIEVLDTVPNYAPIPTVLGNQPVLDSTPTTFSAPQYLAATLPAAYQCLAANPARQSFAITNTGTVNVFLDFDAPTAGLKRFITIVPGGTYVSDLSYVGAVFIWSTTAVAQACEVREFI